MDTTIITMYSCVSLFTLNFEGIVNNGCSVNNTK